MKPLQQLFGLALEQIWELNNKHSEIRKYKKDINKLELDTHGDIEELMKEKEKYCYPRKSYPTITKPFILSPLISKTTV